MTRGKVCVVVGGQLGSEGKGVIVNHIAPEYTLHVRVGGPNAGHSFYYKDKKQVMQSIPCGWTNPDASLLIGAGAVVSPEIFLREIEMIEPIVPNIRQRVIIDGAATVLSMDDHKAEGGVDGELHHRIGSTGEGVGVARLGRIHRDPMKTKLARDIPELKEFIMENTARILADSNDDGENILVEGTQGSGLSLVHGPWPYVTTADTNAGGMLSDAGIAPSRVTDVILVCRTFPIRVAGNSGPLKDELTWEDMSKLTGKKIEEKTTVTKKVRRVGMWDDELFLKACVLNRPTAIALTFADYISPEDEGKTDKTKLSHATNQWIDRLEALSGVPVDFVGTGGEGWQVVDRRR